MPISLKHSITLSQKDSGDNAQCYVHMCTQSMFLGLSHMKHMIGLDIQLLYAKQIFNKFFNFIPIQQLISPCT